MKPRLQRALRRAWRGLLLTLLAVATSTVLLVLALRWLPPPTSMVMLQRHISATPPAVIYSWVPLENIAESAARAVIAAEDQKFSQHFGFDLESVGDALEDHRQGKRLRGASTISQQVAKNLFLWEGRSLLRKALEAGFTLLLEALWPKRRILEIYLNIAEMGPNVFGVEAASQRYFHAPAARLSAPQAALLAAVLPNPRRLRADAPSRYVRERQGWILEQMRRLRNDEVLRTLSQ